MTPPEPNPDFVADLVELIATVGYQQALATKLIADNLAVMEKRLAALESAIGRIESILQTRTKSPNRPYAND
jgi:hypothetical protein